MKIKHRFRSHQKFFLHPNHSLWNCRTGTTLVWLAHVITDPSAKIAANELITRALNLLHITQMIGSNC
jgi:hypothetical protein